MMLTLAWLLATIFLIYLSFKPSLIIGKIALAIFVFVLQIVVLGLGYVGFMFDDELWVAISYLLIMELLICSLYKYRNISCKEIIFGLLSLVILGIWQYYHGSVIGRVTYEVSDIMHKKIPYVIYRWSTYITDVLYPWFIVFNTLISPFWRRDSSTENY